MDSLNNIIKSIDDFVWGIPLIVLIMACGIWLTIRCCGLQFRHLGKALKFMVKNEEGGDGEVSSFAALCTALSATIGTGNIVGVATALAAGGPGALFWMIAAALFGMATKYAEGFLAIKYRTIDAEGHYHGGPYYYIEHGMQNCLRFLECWLACLELVQLHRLMVLLPLQIIFLMQTVRILPLPCLDMTTLGQLLFAAC